VIKLIDIIIFYADIICKYYDYWSACYSEIVYGAQVVFRQNHVDVFDLIDFDFFFCSKIFRAIYYYIL